MPRLTPEAKKFIETNAIGTSNRELRSFLISHKFGTYSHAAIGRYRKKYLDTLKEPEISKVSEISEESEFDRIKSISDLGKDAPNIWEEGPTLNKLLSFNEFMEKLENSTSYAGKHLKDKINVRGKKRAINRERVIRVIRDVLDVLAEL